MRRKLIIYGVASLLSLVLVITTLVVVHRLVLAIYGDVFHKHPRGVWLVDPKKLR